MRSETNRIEYKQQLTEDLEKEAIAFLNYQEGGIIYIGIDKAGKVIGVPDIDGDMLKIKDRLKNNIMPSSMGLFDVIAESIDSKNIIKITFASGTEKPYYIKKTRNVRKRHIYPCRNGSRAYARSNDRIFVCEAYSQLHR